MESSHRKDTANHPDPESCGPGRKARHEALTGADAGEVSSREIRNSGSPTLLCEAEGNMPVSAKASSPTDPRGRRPSTRIEASSAGTGRPHTPPSDDKRLERPAKATSQTVGMAAPGVDGVVWQQYQVNLEVNLKELCIRVHRGSYRAKPSRRVYIPKTDGRMRPLGVAALEDKIVQGAVVEILNAIYEADFLGFSYGFRPGRGAHDALDALATGIQQRKVNWMLDADIRGFFDNINHEWMLKFVQHRIADRRLLRLIGNWLRVGVIEQDQWKASESGTPQGATVSPILANIYLHYVLDTWTHHWRRHHARGEVLLVRYADDFVMGFEQREDAEQFLNLLHQRMGKFGLELHGEKTRLIRFGRFATVQRERRGQGKPETFSFLGFTHISSRSRNGNFLLTRHTMRKRLCAKLSEVKTELQLRRDQPLSAQGEWLGSVLRGHYRYYGVPTNIHALDQFRTELGHAWYRSLRRRSQKRSLNWERMANHVTRWLPRAHICHPWPWDRFGARTQDKSRVR